MKPFKSEPVESQGEPRSLTQALTRVSIQSWENKCVGCAHKFVVDVDMLAIRIGRTYKPSRILETNLRRLSNNRLRPSLSARFNSSLPAANSPPSDITLNSAQPRLSLTFTCTVPDCSHRSTHEFSKRSYERGLVIVQCPSCKNRHLIADHLGWFKDHEGTQGGKLRTIEDLMRAKGEKIQRGRVNEGGVIEFDEE